MSNDNNNNNPSTRKRGRSRSINEDDSATTTQDSPQLQAWGKDDIGLKLNSKYAVLVQKVVVDITILDICAEVCNNFIFWVGLIRLALGICYPRVRTSFWVQQRRKARLQLPY